MFCIGLDIPPLVQVFPWFQQVCFSRKSTPSSWKYFLLSEKQYFPICAALTTDCEGRWEWSWEGKTLSWETTISDEGFYYLQTKEGWSHLVSGEQDPCLQAWKVHHYLKVQGSQGQQFIYPIPGHRGLLLPYQGTCQEWELSLLCKFCHHYECFIIKIKLIIYNTIIIKSQVLLSA